MPSSFFAHTFATSVVLLVLPLVGQASSADAQGDASPAGLCFATTADHERLLIPLESTEVVLDVKPGLLEAEVIQTFSNRTDTALEATYLYPLPGDATLTHFELHYRDRVVRSAVREKAQARLDYDVAKAEGRKAALLAQHDPSLFSTSVANFLPGETVQIVLRFIQPLSLSSRAIDVRFPMVTGQKYFPADSPPGSPGNAAPDPLRRSRDAISPHHVYTFDVQVAGFPVTRIESPSHRIRVEQPAPAVSQFFVSLAENITIPDRDFVLRLETDVSDALKSTAVTQHTDTGDYVLLTLFPPNSRPAGSSPPRPRDVLFLVDRSGSMAGARLESAKTGVERALSSLSPDDRFHIVTFDDRHEFFQPDWTHASPGELAAARHHVLSLQTRGGTELQPALTASFKAFERGHRQQILIILTDGDVGQTDALLNLVESNIGQVRLFPLGIGAAPDATLMKKIASLGRGQARFITNDSLVEREITELFATLEAPVLSDLRLTLLDSEGTPIQHTMLPDPLPDIFSGYPIQAVFRTNQSAPAAVLIEGLDGDELIVRRVALQPTPLRGHGLEKQFGRQLFDDTGVLLRRAQSENERTLIRQEMLETALQFQLVTELTSRVAIDALIARNPDTPLKSQSVRQYLPADQAGGTIISSSGEEVLVLSPFTVDSDADTGYQSSTTLAGSRLRTELHDVASAISGVHGNFVRDVGATSTESLLTYMADAQMGSFIAAPGSNTALLDGLPIATAVDLATVERVTWQTSTPQWGDISQRRALGTFTRLSARVGIDGEAAGTLESAHALNTRGDASVLAILSGARFENTHWSGYLEGKRQYGESTLRASAQWRDLHGYGNLRLVRATLQHTFSDTLFFDAIIAWHRLNRENPEQFSLASPTARYEGLGFHNLDLLTAATRRLEDGIAQVALSGRVQGDSIIHVWSALLRWHGQSSDWLTPFSPSPVAPRRDTLRLAANYRLRLFDDRLSLNAHVEQAAHHTAGESLVDRDTHHVGVGATWKLSDGVHLFADAARERILPWTPRGTWLVSGSSVVALSNALETRETAQVGARLNAWDDRLSGYVSIFHEDAHNHSFRDWRWEQQHPTAFAVAADSIRAPISMSVRDHSSREGWMGSFDFNPTRSFTARASWSHAWNSDGPYRGGATNASLVTRYEVRAGRLKGLIAGSGLSYRDDLVFEDGHVLHGGLRVDVMLGIRLRSTSRNETLLQANLVNLTHRSWQLTRFAPDRGRQLLFTVSHEF